MTADRVRMALAILAIALVLYALAVFGLMQMQGLSLREAMSPNEATVGFPLLGGLSLVMLWRNR
jgi:hypothetical protein